MSEFYDNEYLDEVFYGEGLAYSLREGWIDFTKIQEIGLRELVREATEALLTFENAVYAAQERYDEIQPLAPDYDN